MLHPREQVLVLLSETIQMLQILLPPIPDLVQHFSRLLVRTEKGEINPLTQTKPNASQSNNPSSFFPNSNFSPFSIPTSKHFQVEVVFMQDYFKDIYNDPDNALFTASEISFDFVNSEAVVKGYLPTVTTNYNFMYGVYANAKIEIYYPADQSGGPEPESSTPTGVYLGGLPGERARFVTRRVRGD